MHEWLPWYRSDTHTPAALELADKLRGEGYTVRVDKKRPDTFGGVVRPFSKVFICRGVDRGCTKGCVTI